MEEKLTAYPPIAIANYFITHPNDKYLDLMKIQKMIYMAHGMVLALYGDRLINEAIEAWRYGPVIRSVYEAFKEYRLDILKKVAKTENGKTYQIQIDDSRVKNILDTVIKICKGKTGIQLSNWSHEEGSPWDKVYNKTLYGDSGCAEIPNKQIKKYFSHKTRPVTS